MTYCSKRASGTDCFQIKKMQLLGSLHSSPHPPALSSLTLDLTSTNQHRDLHSSSSEVLYTLSEHSKHTPRGPSHCSHTDTQLNVVLHSWENSVIIDFQTHGLKSKNSGNGLIFAHKANFINRAKINPYFLFIKKNKLIKKLKNTANCKNMCIKCIQFTQKWSYHLLTLFF